MLFQDASGLDLNAARLIALIDHLRNQPAETEWLEFKHNNGDGKVIGKCIAALANAARLADRDRAYMVWGVADGTHAVVGTTFQPSSARMENQPLAFWLAQRLNPSPGFTFHSVPHPNGAVVLLVSIREHLECWRRFVVWLGLTRPDQALRCGPLRTAPATTGASCATRPT